MRATWGCVAMSGDCAARAAPGGVRRPGGASDGLRYVIGLWTTWCGRWSRCCRRSGGGAGRGPSRPRRRPPPAVGHARYTKRDVVEGCVAQPLQWRAVATRHDTTARTYLGGVTLAAAVLWLRGPLRDTPWWLPRPTGGVGGGEVVVTAALPLGGCGTEQ